MRSVDENVLFGAISEELCRKDFVFYETKLRNFIKDDNRKYKGLRTGSCRKFLKLDLCSTSSANELQKVKTT